MATMAPVPAAQLRNVYIKDRLFVHRKTGLPIVMSGPNVVVKGSPWIPSVSGNGICDDHRYGTCYTFNQHDVDHLKSRGWNAIRLGVIWAGAQPRDEPVLDPAFLQRLHAILNLTDRNDIHVILDNHGDQIASANCGNGAPMWFSQKAAPFLIGKPLESSFPFDILDLTNVQKAPGYWHCGNNKEKWAQHAGDPDYNVKNECCRAMNGPNPSGLGYSSLAQATMTHMLKPGSGRDDFVRYWRLIAEAVRDHPSAIAAELMNEPPSIERQLMFDTWRACQEAINQVIPDMSVSIMDVEENGVVPAWVGVLPLPLIGINKATDAWIKNSTTLMYTWHYGNVPEVIIEVESVSLAWNLPTMGTELGCEHMAAAKKAFISHLYWHYSSYCDNRGFGKCILGSSDGGSSKCSPGNVLLV